MANPYFCLHSYLSLKHGQDRPELKKNSNRVSSVLQDIAIVIVPWI